MIFIDLAVAAHKLALGRISSSTRRIRAMYGGENTQVSVVNLGTLLLALEYLAVSVVGLRCLGPLHHLLILVTYSQLLLTLSLTLFNYQTLPHAGVVSLGPDWSAMRRGRQSRLVVSPLLVKGLASCEKYVSHLNASNVFPPEISPSQIRLSVGTGGSWQELKTRVRESKGRFCIPD